MRQGTYKSSRICHLDLHNTSGVLLHIALTPNLKGFFTRADKCQLRFKESLLSKSNDMLHGVTRQVQNVGNMYMRENACNEAAQIE